LEVLIWNESVLIRKAQEAANEVQGIPMKILSMQHPKPSRTIVDHIEDEESYGFLVVGVAYKLGRNDPGNRMGRSLLHFAPYDMLFLDPGDRDMGCCREIIVPMGGHLESLALQTAVDCAKQW
jgi:hypothetical protein